MIVLAGAAPVAAEPLGSAFTYQGQLSGASGPVSASCDLRFRLYDALTTGAQQGPEVPRNGEAISSGLFTVVLDFGVAFAGERRWLEVDVRCPAGSGAFTTLPRQEITPAPYSLTSLSTIALQGRPVSAAAPASGDVLAWNGSSWTPNPPATTIGTPTNTPNSLVQRDAVGRFATAGITLDAGSAGAPALSAGADGGLFGAAGGVGIGAAGAEAARFTASLATIQPPLLTASDISQLSGVLTLAPMASGGRVRQDGSDLLYQRPGPLGRSLYLGPGSGGFAAADSGSNLGIGVGALSHPPTTAQCNLGVVGPYRNTAIGAGALDHLVCGDSSVALGADAGSRLGTGSRNIYLQNFGPPAAPGSTGAESDTIRIGESQTRAFVSGVFGADQPHHHIGGSLDQNERRIVTADAAGQLGGAWVPTIVWGEWVHRSYPLVSEAIVACPHAIVLGCGCIGDQGQISHQVAIASELGGVTVRGCQCTLRPDLLALTAGVVAQAICLEPAP